MELNYVKSKIRVQVSGPVESEKSIGVLVDLIFDENGRYNSASRLEWFPKSQCELEKIENEGFLPSYFLIAPKWILDKNKVKYKIDNESKETNKL